MPPAMPTMVMTTSAVPPPPVVDGGDVVGGEVGVLPPQPPAAATRATAARHRVPAHDDSGFHGWRLPGPPGPPTGTSCALCAAGGRGSPVTCPARWPSPPRCRRAPAGPPGCG